MSTKQLSKTIWVVIPGYNEERYLDTVLQKVSHYTSQIIYVDDGSLDASARIAKQHTPHVLVHSLNLGKGAALKTGCDYAFKKMGAGAVILMDSDDQHNPAHLIEFERALTQAPLVFGARKIDAAMPVLKQIMNKAATYLVKSLFGGQAIPDIPSGYKAFTTDVYHLLRWNSTGYQVEMEIACRVAKHQIPFTVLDIDTIYHDHDKGMTLLTTLEFLHTILVWRVTL